ncbi:MAG: hypothetical protein H6822_16250 [Planctomycetaceae bacterium]|nr:hypothetical protein [Planctomycetales bacterium]MCB9923733.1 hypothetical protein [Planctomycetaceae bacterium]
MMKKILISLLSAVSVVVMLVDTVSAVPRWRRSNNYTYYSSGYTQVAAKSDDHFAGYPQLEVYCDYEAAQDLEVAFTDRIRVFMNVWDQEIIDSKESMVAEVKITDTSNYETSYLRHVPVAVSEVADQEYRLATFDLTNTPEVEDLLIKPATVYRMFIALHRESETYDENSAWGRLPGPYYVVTSGDTDLERARHRIVMRTFREWYYTERGWYRNATYPMDCHAYYLWATGPCTVGASNDWANLGALFGTYHNGGHIAELMESDRIHGDYVRKPGHTFMLLSYDPEMGHVWTMEANFNHTIEVCIRSVDYGWTVGHLVAEHIRPDLFAQLAESGTAEIGEDAMARAETDGNGEEAVAIE